MFSFAADKVSRYLIRVEDAYRLIDLYTQEVEKCGSVESVWQQQFNCVYDSIS